MRNRTDEKKGRDWLKPTLLALVINAVIVLMEIYATIMSLVEDGAGAFKYYTFLSNVYGGFVCGIHLYFLFWKYVKQKKMNKIIILVKYSATSCLTLTFIVVLTLLSWEGELVRLLFGKTGIVQHFLAPLGCLFSFLVLEVNYVLPWKYVALPIGLTFLYGVVLIPLNVADVLEGPYFFLRASIQPWYETILWILALFAFIGVISLLVLFCTNRINKKFPKKEDEIDISGIKDIQLGIMI